MSTRHTLDCNYPDAPESTPEQRRRQDQPYFHVYGECLDRSGTVYLDIACVFEASNRGVVLEIPREVWNRLVALGPDPCSSPCSSTPPRKPAPAPGPVCDACQKNGRLTQMEPGEVEVDGRVMLTLCDDCYEKYTGLIACCQDGCTRPLDHTGLCRCQ